MVQVLHSFVLRSVFRLVTRICYFPVFFVISMNTSRLALAATPAMRTSLAETCGGEKNWNAMANKCQIIEKILKPQKTIGLV